MLSWLTGLVGGKIGLALAGGLLLSLIGTGLAIWQWQEAREDVGRLEAQLSQAIEVAEANRLALWEERDTARRQSRRAVEDLARLEARLRAQQEILDDIADAEDGPAADVLRGAADRLRERSASRHQD